VGEVLRRDSVACLQDLNVGEMWIVVEPAHVCELRLPI
jgi:hypothetical protein